MKNNFRRLTAFILVLMLVLATALPVVAANQPTSYSDVRNSGQRDVVCTTLNGTGAADYYTGNNTYDKLSELSSTALLNSLRTLMKTTHKKQTSYDNCRDYADETDCENGNTTIVTLYTSYKSSQSEYDGGNGWNREHVWPKSLGGFSTSGAGADLHHIRPSENKTNSDRGNLKYGNVSGTPNSKGNLSGLVGGTKGSYYEPLDNVKGDVARICLYVYVRYGGELSKCNSITNVFQSVDVLLEWCELDPVDTWEMGRNEVVEKIQGNRNVFIDYPEFAWLIFGREVPSDMTTPSGEAKGGSGSGTGSGTTTCQHTTSVVKNAVTVTCGRSGYTGDTYCSSCGVKISTGTKIPATGNHTWGPADIITPPTATTEGEQMQLCTVCGESKITSIPKLDDPSGGGGTGDPCRHQTTVLKNAVDATCGEDGYSGDTYCSECDELISSGSVIPATGNHNWSDYEVVLPPTATSEGVARETCDECGKTRDTSIEKLPTTDPGTGNEPGSDPTNPGDAYLVIISIAKSLFDSLFVESLS